MRDDNPDELKENNPNDRIDDNPDDNPMTTKRQPNLNIN
jgi:hypothetical protein